MKIIYIGLILACTTTTIAQDLSKMPKTKRDSFLLNITKKIILRFGNERYYREIITAKIDSTPNAWLYKNKEAYRVTYYYDSTKFTMNTFNLARIHLDKKSGRPLDIQFGTGYGIDLNRLPDSLLVFDTVDIDYKWKLGFASFRPTTAEERAEWREPELYRPGEFPKTKIDSGFKAEAKRLLLNPYGERIYARHIARATIDSSIIREQNGRRYKIITVTFYPDTTKWSTKLGFLAKFEFYHYRTATPRRVIFGSGDERIGYIEGHKEPNKPVEPMPRVSLNNVLIKKDSTK